MTQPEIIAKLQSIVTETGSQSKAALRLGITPGYLGELLRGTRKPGKAIFKALGLKKEIVITEETAT